MMYLIILSFIFIFLQFTEISSLKCVRTIHNQRINKLSFNNNKIHKRQITTTTIAINSPLFSQSNAISYDVTTNKTNNKQNSIMSIITKLFNIKLFKHLTILLSTILLFTKQAFAATAAAYKSSTASNGWDIYGRVPYDDWLFTNWRLTDPNLLRRSYVECVSRVYVYTVYNIIWHVCLHDAQYMTCMQTTYVYAICYNILYTLLHR